jgi:hypothetical protein
MQSAILSISKMLVHTPAMALSTVEFYARFRGGWKDVLRNVNLLTCNQEQRLRLSLRNPKPSDLRSALSAIPMRTASPTEYAAALCYRTLLGLTHSLRKNKTLRLLPCVAMTEIRSPCVSPIYFIHVPN